MINAFKILLLITGISLLLYYTYGYIINRYKEKIFKFLK